MTRPETMATETAVSRARAKGLLLVICLEGPGGGQQHAAEGIEGLKDGSHWVASPSVWGHCTP